MGRLLESKPKLIFSVLSIAVVTLWVSVSLLYGGASGGAGVFPIPLSINTPHGNKVLISSSPLSKNVIVYRAYYDSRKKTAEHSNQTVFFVDANWTIIERKWIVGCGVNGKKAKDFKVRMLAEWYWAPSGYKYYKKKKGKQPKTYQHVYVDCFDMAVEPGDRVFLLYKTNEKAEPVAVEPDHPIIFPEPRVSTQNVSIVSCIKANSKQAPLLGEILHYQTILGVDHISLIAISSYIKDGGLKQLLTNHPYVIPLFVQSYITVDLWKWWWKSPSEVRMFSEILRKIGCSYHYRGTYDYAFPIDTDDFFTPREPGKANIKHYLLKHCYEGKIGSCMLKWIHYYPQYCGLNEIPDDKNVTSALKSLSFRIGGANKSIHKTQILLDATFHDAIERGPDKNLMPGYEVVSVPYTSCAVSHMRSKPVPKDLEC